jgi:hypothetical protein
MASLFPVARVSTGPAVIVEFAVSMVVTAEVTAAIDSVDRCLYHSGFDHGCFNDWCFHDRGLGDSDGVGDIVATVRPIAPTAVNESAIETVASVLMTAGSIVAMSSRPTSAALVSTLAAALRERWRTSSQGQCDNDGSDEGGLVRHGRAPRFFKSFVRSSLHPAKRGNRAFVTAKIEEFARDS